MSWIPCADVLYFHGAGYGRYDAEAHEHNPQYTFQKGTVQRPEEVDGHAGKD
jgi:hypothetical protein